MPYNIVMQTNETTVVTKYKQTKPNANRFQSEGELEAALIKQLVAQGYERLAVHTQYELAANIKVQLEKLNDIEFTGDEWDRFYNSVIANPNEHIREKTSRIQENNVKDFVMDDGSIKNITLIDKDHIQQNSLQVINQYENGKAQGAAYDNRYDVTILVNGLPLVHVELKRRGVNLQEAFNQINRYQRESFWAGDGLFEWVQVFVISNGTYTKYYSNSTRESARRDAKMTQDKKSRQAFEFTSFWTDEQNTPITDLEDFAATFFSRHTLLSILTHYCVFTCQQQLMVMRPYQITACERILGRIQRAHSLKQYGSTNAGGYIWHTTGSGKTLTSFKTAQLAMKLEYIDKVLFVVDRKDLDYQTIREYNKFQKDCVSANTSTAVLEAQLADSSFDKKIIVTTIQKLSLFTERHKTQGHSVFEKQVVIIFDECHRSQFGDMHAAITSCFKHYYIFGFTGTPIFSDNAPTYQGSRQLAKGRMKKTGGGKTTQMVFGDELHKYTIVDAINDGNVLPFRVDYVNDKEAKEGIKDESVQAIDKGKALNAPQRIEKVVAYVLDHYEQKTKHNNAREDLVIPEGSDAKTVSEIRDKWSAEGFNAIFAADSIDAAKLYYAEFKRQMSFDPKKTLRVALIYSFAANEATKDADGKGTVAEENSEDTSGLDQSSKDFLKAAIADYNAMYDTDFDVSGESFQRYYQDVSCRTRERKLDILIVVNMFLTGFDAKTLNTLFVDKNLQYHGLIQAFSRTNRILDSVKTFGNIVCFRDLREDVDEAIALFGQGGEGIILMRSFDEYYKGYTDDKGRYHRGYEDMVAELKARFPLGQEIASESERREFVKLFGAILKTANVLSSFDEFFERGGDDQGEAAQEDGEGQKGRTLFAERVWQDYTSKYISEWEKIDHHRDKAVDITDDLVFELELVEQIEINIDYILAMIAKYYGTGSLKADPKVIESAVLKAASSSPTLRSKKQLIREFVEYIARQPLLQQDMEKAWRKFIRGKLVSDLEEIIAQEQLKPQETVRFMARSFRSGEVKSFGEDIGRILPPVSSRGGKRKAKREAVVALLEELLQRYAVFGVGETLDSEEGT